MNAFKTLPKMKKDGIIGLVLVAAVLIYSQFAADSVLDFMSRTVIMMLFASALNISWALAA